MVIHMRKIFFSFLIIFVLSLIYYFSQQPWIHFIQDEIHLSLYDEIKPYDYIEEVSHVNIKEIKINNKVNNKKLGKYQIEYQYKNKI